MSEVDHHPSEVDLFAFWRLPYELAAGYAMAVAGIMAGGLGGRQPHAAQLPIPEPIEEHGEHALFA